MDADTLALIQVILGSLSILGAVFVAGLICLLAWVYSALIAWRKP